VKHTDPEIRRTALWALARCDDMQLVPAMIDAFEESNVDVLVEVRNALCTLTRMPRGLGMSDNPFEGLPANATQESGLDFNDIANRYEISGGMIMNVIRYCCMQAIARDETILRKGDFVEGIRREYAKENRLD